MSIIIQMRPRVAVIRAITPLRLAGMNMRPGWQVLFGFPLNSKVGGLSICIQMRPFIAGFGRPVAFPLVGHDMGLGYISAGPVLNAGCPLYSSTFRIIDDIAWFGPIFPVAALHVRRQ